MIETFALKRESEKHEKVEQVCRNKQRYLSKFSMTRYYLWMVAFLIFFLGMMGVSLAVLLTGNEF